MIIKKSKNSINCYAIIDCLRNMNVVESADNGYISVYIMTDLTDKLHEIFGFRTDFEILNNKTIKNIFRLIKE